MNSIEHVIVHYGLLILSVGGVTEIARVLWITLRDLKALDVQGVNGPKRIVVVTRQYQSAFLLAVFAVLLGLGGRVALAKEYEIEGPLILTFIVAVDTIALLLGLKEWTIRRARHRLDAYADHELATRVVHVHRRTTDIAVKQPNEEKD